jgi:PAS domain S-box-containing protein
MDSTEAFRQKIEAMYIRLEQLYSHIERDPTPELLPTTWKELGIAVEELQVANEELCQQNAQIVESIHVAAGQHYYYQHLLNHVPEAYLVTTAEGKIQEVNLLASRLLRLPQSSLVGKLLVSFVPSDYRLPFRSELNQLLRAGKANQVRSWSAWVQPRDMAPIHLALVTSVVVDPNSNQVQIHWLLREMSETWAAIQPVSTAAQLSTSSNGVSDAQTLEALLQRPTQLYSRGEIIPLHPQSLWQVQQGLVKLHTLTQESEEVLLGLLGPSMPFGSGSTFLPVYQATALTDVQLIQFSLAEVKAFPQLAQLLLPKLNHRFQQMEALLAIAGQRRIKHRLYLMLNFLQREIGEPLAGGTRLSIRLTHEDLANACCTTRVTITRLLGELQKQGKIWLDAKSHIILREKL